MLTKDAKLSLHIIICASLVILVLATNKKRHHYKVVHSVLHFCHSQHPFIPLLAVRC